MPELVKPPITRLQILRFAAVTGDTNPVHVNDFVARRAGFDGVIAHGMLSMSFLGEYLTRVAGAGNVRRFKARFRQPVRPGDVITCKGRVKAVAPCGPMTLAVVEVWAENQKGQRVTTGVGEVLVPDLVTDWRDS
ncbi:MaoC family dehydratase [Thermaerobacter composti]|uniref:MaoC family dehydratase n=1 Tax=Thermaerobacter composti TaxID=554949 RepID=A0ABZ0QS50_9FIRM|nr:MaoC family dehydratase [Thermaerobacter composti]WPD20305.1 MaoC family dehydratase [Thermaerobacter composti]